MGDILAVVAKWLAGGASVSLATVVGVWRSAPRQPGAAMAVTAAGEVAGSVSGGCVEGAVVELAEQVIATGAPQLATFGVTDEDALSVGLTCGGEIEIFVEAITGATASILREVATSVADEESVALATVVQGEDQVGRKMAIWPDRTAGSLGDEGLEAAVTDDARGMLAQGATARRRYGTRGQRRMDDVTVFVESLAARPRMLIFGAIDFASAVARLGSVLGYRVTVCDARARFATRERFPEADEVIVEWPHRFLEQCELDTRTVVCVLTHDPKFDVPLLELALRMPSAYVGAMGSRRTHEDRIARLRERGLTDAELARLHSPLGLDIGARTPEETAVSIAAEIIKARWGGTGRPLRETDGPIHRKPARPDGLNAAQARTVGGRMSV